MTYVILPDCLQPFWYRCTASAAAAAAAAAKSFQSCPTLCDPIDGSPSGSPVPGILQARTLEWVAISFSNAWKWKVKVKSLSGVRLLATPWTAAYQAPPSIFFLGFSKSRPWGFNEIFLISSDLITPLFKYNRMKVFIQQNENWKILKICRN